MEISEKIVEEASKRVVEGFRRPTEEFIGKCGVCLEKRGWLRSVAGEENFRKGAEAWAKAICNGMGIMVLGPNGVGKSAYLRAVSLQDQLNRRLRTFDLKTSDGKLYLNPYEYREWLLSCLEYNVFIDDLGLESKVSQYGQFSDPAIDFILDYVERGKGRLYISSNLCQQKDGVSELVERYGSRIDCLREVVVPVIFHGQSVRRWI